MKHKKMRFPQDIYFQYLNAINGIKFTHREIDTMAFIISGRITKKIASFLSISPKTVDSHIHNIMIKLGANSREDIIEFIENSGKFSIMKQYYLALWAQSSFEKKLKEISILLDKEAPPAFWMVYGYKQGRQGSIIEHLIIHLKLAGIKISHKSKKQYEALNLNLKDPPTHTLFIVSDVQLKELSVLTEKRKEKDEEDEFSSIFKLTQSVRQKPKAFTFLLLNRDMTSIDIPKEIADIRYVDFREEKNYYFLVLDLLKRIFPDLNFDKIISEFTKDYSLIYDSSGRVDFQDDDPSSQVFSRNSHQKHKEKGEASLHVPETSWKKRLSCWLGLFLFICLVGIGYLTFIPRDLPIRSNLVLSAKSILLNRPELISQLEDKFKENNIADIQTVALVGIGGTGKTTLAYEYARAYKGPIVWQIAAENPTTLKNSFETLAYALAQTEEDKKTLRSLQDIKSTEEKDVKILFFVKEKMKAHPHWLLIFDNVEAFEEILPYFPDNPTTWGPGKVLLTTRDAHIQSNKYVAHIIPLGELDHNQKLYLFLTIMTHGIPSSFTPLQREEAKGFLTQIPPFPLDVALAAYYIKATHTSYDKYLHHLNQLAEGFEHVQENILKGSGDYTKTRYHIVALSLKKLMETHKDFGDLLLFMSLLDSHHIPRDLLDAYKDDVVVDDFIHHLKKYSLVTDEEASSSLNSMFSMHQSTQEIGLAYLTEALDLKHNHKLLQTISTTLENYMADAIDKDDLERMKLLIAHCEWFLKHPQLLEDKEKEAIGGELGGLYFYIKNYPKAQQVLEESLHKEDVNPHTVSTFVYLSLVYMDLAEYEKAKTLLEKSLSYYQQHDPNNHLRIAQLISYLANLEGDKGRYEESRDLFEQSLAMYKQDTTQAPLQRARVLTSLANVYREFAEYEKAKELLEESILIYKKHTPENHVRMAWALALLGNVSRSLGQYNKAKDRLEESLAIYQKNYPDNHVSIAWVSTHLGNTYRKLGQYKKAKSLLEKSYFIYTTYFSDNHVANAWVLTHLGNTYKELGSNGKAKEAFEKSYDIYQAHNLGTLWSGAHLGNFYRELGRPEKAKEFLEESYAIYQEHPAEKDVRLAMLLRYLGNLYRDSRDYEKAKAFLKKSQSLYAEICGQNHIETARVVHDLGKTYLREYDLETAEPLLQNALAVMEQAHHPDVTRVLETFADLEFRKSAIADSGGNPSQAQAHRDQAAVYLKKALDIAKTHLPEDSSHIRRIQSKFKFCNE